MAEWNQWLFSLMAAGHRPDAEWLPLARWLAAHGAAVGIGALCLVGWAWPARRGRVLLVAGLAALASLMAHALADAFGFPRPFVVGDSAPWIAHGGRGAFPSAHASVMFTVALGLWQVAGLRRVALAFAALGLATAWARVYGGLHYPLDIVGGALLALLLVNGLRFMGLWLCVRAAWPWVRTARRLCVARRWRAMLAVRRRPVA